MPTTAAATELPAYILEAAAGRERMRGAEWLLTNGIGGFAMGTAAGVPTRRYHGLLVAAMAPPVQRDVMLHSLVERVVVAPGTDRERGIDLCCFRFCGGMDHPRGDEHLARFERTPTACRWAWAVGELKVSKTLRLYHGRNAAAVEYRVSGAAELVRFQARPLVAMRDSHALLARDGAAGEFRVEATQRRARVRRMERALDLGCDAGWFQEDAQWWNAFEYEQERERGYDSREDLFSPGVFSVQVRPGAELTLALTAWVGDEPGRIADDESAQRRRLAGFVEATANRLSPESAEADRDAAARLAVASDDFVVQRGEGPEAGVSVIAGYPWFADWGRDTAISLPGLLLCTGRFEDAARVLKTFAANRKHGLIPNRFDDRTGEAEYNTVDASLWFIHAACEYLRVSGDRKGWEADIRGACLEIVGAYRAGTDFGIRMDEDGLITAGDETTQLTWMDARRDGVVFTPRHGKAVEINALWVHGLRVLAGAMADEEPRRSRELSALAAGASEAFAAQFWNEEAGCCYDVLTPGAGGSWGADARIRPNQILAASLEHSPLSMERRRRVVGCVKERLLTPLGLRTLDPGDSGYRGRYRGTMWERDAAYHNGTVWPWLLGAYCEAVLRCGEFSAAARREARGAVEPLVDAMRTEFLGLIPEVFDGDEEAGRARRAGGCIHQAWSVAEALRALCLIDGPQGSKRTPRASGRP